MSSRSRQWTSQGYTKTVLVRNISLSKFTLTPTTHPVHNLPPSAPASNPAATAVAGGARRRGRGSGCRSSGGSQHRRRHPLRPPESPQPAAEPPSWGQGGQPPRLRLGQPTGAGVFTVHGAGWGVGRGAGRTSEARVAQVVRRSGAAGSRSEGRTNPSVVRGAAGGLAVRSERQREVSA